MAGFSDILNEDKGFEAKDALYEERHGAVDLPDRHMSAADVLLSGAKAESRHSSSFLSDEKPHSNHLRGIRKTQARKVKKQLEELDDAAIMDLEEASERDRRQRAHRIARVGAFASAANYEGDAGDDFGGSVEAMAEDILHGSTRSLSQKTQADFGELAESAGNTARDALARKKQKLKAVKARKKIISQAAQKKTLAVHNAVESQRNATRARELVEQGRKAIPLLGGASTGVLMGALVAVIILCLTIALIIGTAVGEQWAEEHRINFEGLTETEQIVARYLMEHGLDELHTAAIMGNISQECSFDPALIENGSALGVGIFQWPTTADYLGGMSHGNRFKAYAASTNRSWTDIYAQLDYAWYEIAHEEVSGRPSMFADNQWCWNREIGCTAFKRTNNITANASFENWLAIDDIEVATEYFCWGFLRPASSAAHIDARISGDSNGHKGALYYYAVLTGATGAEGNNAIERAYAQLGKPYVWGACGPNAFDCSGLVSYCITGKFERFCTTDTMASWPRVDDPVPGDFCLSSHHTGIYIGGGKMIHAPHTGDVVKISNVQSDMWYVRYPSY